jgi:TetR/AcrR family transcriptional repressor of nem operon
MDGSANRGSFEAMPREKQFDEADVLDKAMQAFWARGYETTSIQDLVDGTGLKRGSIYAAFGSKRGLFLRTLERYETQHRRAWLDALRQRHCPRAAILAVFEGAISAALSDSSRSGCFLVNTAIELSPHDDEIARVVAKGLAETEAFFCDLIREAQRHGTLSAQLDATGTARTLLGLLIGLRVLARSRPECPLLEALMNQAASMLG